MYILRVDGVFSAFLHGNRIEVDDGGKEGGRWDFIFFFEMEMKCRGGTSGGL